jgi:hypothetical protein
MAACVAQYGPVYLSAGVLLAGLLQIGAGAAGLGKFIRITPLPVMLGFVNGLAFVMTKAQVSRVPPFRSVLHARIAQRFHWMLEQGFEQEVRKLYNRGDLHLDLPSMRCVGYRQMWHYLDGQIGYDEMVERGIIATRQLAKRQLTWLRGWPDLQALDTSEISSIDYCQQVLRQL